MAEKKKRRKWWLFLLIPIGVIGFYFLSIFGEIFLFELMNGEGSPFEKGKGTVESPYIIKTAEQLIEFSNKVNDGYTYEGKYICLESDIVLNDEVFTFNKETKMVKVTDGLNVGYLKMIAEAEEGSKLDWLTSDLGKWYTDDKGTVLGEYTGEIIKWESIGYSLQCLFKGTFNGNGHTISGMFSYSYGLFGYVSDATIRNVNIENSYICNANYVGGIVGNSSSETLGDVGNLIENCCFSGYICGYDCIGGIIGRTFKTKIINCENKGIVSGYLDAGGIVGFTSKGTLSYATIENCSNFGMVQGVIHIGGIVGSLSKGDAINCLNAGEVLGNEAAGGITGGISFADETGSIKNCINVGTVKQALEFMENKSYVGAITGYKQHEIINCYVKDHSSIYLIGEYTDPIDEASIKVLTIDQLNKQESYKELDFNNVWVIDGEYPTIKK